MDCLQPPLEEAPTGKWHCPMCPPLHFPGFFQPELPPELQADSHPDIHNTTDQGSPSNCQPIRASSVASTSYSREPQTRAASSRKGKGKAIFTDESEIESPLTRRQRRAKKDSRGRVRTSETEEEEPEMDSTPRAIKRMKLKLGTRPPPPNRVVVRLKLPPKSKGKEREEEESALKDMFEDLLSAEDRDTSKTLIDASDKARYEKSRTQAEVHSPPPSTPLELYSTCSYRRDYSHHNSTQEHRHLHIQDPSAGQHTPNSLPKPNHPHHDPSTLPYHPPRIPIHHHPSPFRPSLHLQHRRCEHEPFGSANTISRLGTMPRFQRSTPICRMEGCGYASFA